MWSFSFVILVFGVLLSAAQSDDNVESEQCNGPPPIRMNPFSCCEKPIFKPDFRICMNKTRQILMQRYREGKNDKNADENADEACLANCFSNNKIFEDDKINRDELVKALETETDDSVWLPIHSIAVDKCIEVLQPDFEKIQNTKWVQKCNRMAVRMLLCLNGQYFVNCPEKYFQNDNENCKEFQKHIKSCPMPRGGPWNHGKGGRGFGKGRSGFGPDFGSPPNFRFGSDPSFGEGPHFGPGPNFGTGEAFGFV